MSEYFQETTRGRRLGRAAVGGLLPALYAFVFLPLWTVPVLAAIGVIAGLAAPTLAATWRRTKRTVSS